MQFAVRLRWSHTPRQSRRLCAPLQRNAFRERDAPYVLDGVLYNESDLELEEHYTDTHGYTESNFAAFAMLGKEFCPRIRKISNQRIYCIDPNRDYGALAPLFNRKGSIPIRNMNFYSLPRKAHVYRKKAV